MQRSLIPCQINTVDNMAILHFNILKSTRSDVINMKFLVSLLLSKLVHFKDPHLP